MGAKIKILIVDDDWDFIEISRISLEAQGYEVLEAATAKDGWKILGKKNPDLIIMDLMMENLDSGMALSEKIKKHAQFSSIPILMLTSITRETGMDFSPRNAEDLRDLHVDDFSTKPIKSKLLLEKVAKLLAKEKNPKP
jgi:CheY-like chemotaxis protein